jgi:hypothetical protein
MTIATLARFKCLDAICLKDFDSAGDAGIDLAGYGRAHAPDLSDWAIAWRLARLTQG